MEENDFELPIMPEWREKYDPNKTLPNIPTMINDIVAHLEKWKKIKESHPRDKIDKKLKEISIRFFVHIQTEEDIGVRTEEETKKIIDEHDEHDEHNTHEEEGKTHAEPLGNRKLTQEQHDNQINQISKRLKIECNTEDSEKENISIEVISCPEEQRDGISRSQETVGEMYDEYSSSHPDKLPDKSKLETLNLYKAYKHLQVQIKQLHEDEIKDCSQLLDVETCIQETHEILMDGVLSKGNTKPGMFSTAERYATFNGVKYHYPHYSEDKYAFAAVQTLVDHYNEAVQATKLKTEKLTAESLEKVFKGASIFLFTFLQLHPFSDGNGRLGRLLCSYFLGLVCPFPSPIYNVCSKTQKSDFVKTLTDAREYLSGSNKGKSDVGASYGTVQNSDATDSIKDKELWIIDKRIEYKHDAENMATNLIRCNTSNLCALIIESNWSTWEKFLAIIESS